MNIMKAIFASSVMSSAREALGKDFTFDRRQKEWELVRKCGKTSEVIGEDYGWSKEDESTSSAIYVPCTNRPMLLSYCYWKKDEESDEIADRTICEEPFDDPRKLIAWAEARCKALDANPECQHPGMFFINSDWGLPLTRLVCDSKKNGHTLHRYSETTDIIGYKNIWLGEGAVHALILAGDFHENEQFPIRVGIGYGRMSEVTAVVDEFGEMVRLDPPVVEFDPPNNEGNERSMHAIIESPCGTIKVKTEAGLENFNGRYWVRGQAVRKLPFVEAMHDIYERHKAAITIQRAWRLAISCPAFSLCTKRLFHEFHDCVASDSQKS